MGLNGPVYRVLFYWPNKSYNDLSHSASVSFAL